MTPAFGTVRWRQAGKPSFAARLVATLLIAASLVSAIPTISIKGSKFFTSDGDEFYIKGVVYSPTWQQHGNNLANGSQCAIDAPLIQKLGANVIRVFSVDPSLDHDSCMQAFSDAGIYLMVDLATPNYHIDSNAPQWNVSARDQLAKVIDSFQKYDNMFAFTSGSEVVTNSSTSGAAAYVKASIADLKAYRDAMGYREIPIGYTAADSEDIRTYQQDYFDCGNASVAADYFAYNRYSWCGDSSMIASGYDTLYVAMDGYDLPTFFSETGCRTSSDAPPNRTFTDQTAILGRSMNDRFSGAIVYEWHEEDSNYGLVSYDNSAWTGTPSLYPDYTTLSEQWATLTPTGVQKSAYTATGTRKDCPVFSSSTWSISANQALPTVGLKGVNTATAAKGTATGTGTGSGSQSDQTGAAGGGHGSGGDNNSSSGLSAGAVAGIVLGALVAVALLLGALLFFLKRKRKQREAAAAVAGNGHAPESDKIVATSENLDSSVHGYYGPQKHPAHEMVGAGQTQELDPSKGHVAPMRANELAQPEYDHELSNSHQRHEMTRAEDVPPAVAAHEGAQEARQQEPSPYVQAQRRMEMDWLESEEQRLRQRRALLMQQDGAANTQS